MTKLLWLCTSAAAWTRAPRRSAAAVRRAPATRRRALDVERDDRWPTWSESVDPNEKLLYMPFLEKQLEIMDGLGAVERPEDITDRLALATRRPKSGEGGKPAARVGSRVWRRRGRQIRGRGSAAGWSRRRRSSRRAVAPPRGRGGVACRSLRQGVAATPRGGLGGTVRRPVAPQVFAVADRFRRVRMTYFDGGKALQVFNSLWYPTFDRPDAPLLGVDLLRFGPKKFLCVVDAQPPGGRGDDGAVPHLTDRLDAIRAAPGREALRGEVSSRWYVRRAHMFLMNRGDAAAATWIFRGGEPRRRRGWDL